MVQKIIFLSLLVIILNACIKEASDIVLPEFKSKFVVNSFISPDDTAYIVSLTLNKKIYGNINSDKILDQIPKVFISDGINSVQLDTFHKNYYDTVQMDYFISSKKMKVLEGKNYSLSVLENNESKAIASSTVPVRRNFNFHVDTTMTEVIDLLGWGGKHLNIGITVNFIDFPNETNYYKIAAFFVGYYKYNTDETHQLLTKIAVDGTFKEDIFDDKGKDGKEFFASTTIERVPSLKYWNFDSAFVKVYLLNLSKDYYEYQKSLDNYKGGFDNPFQEIYPVYSNVTGGLGIFCTYTQDLKVFKLK